MAKVFYFGILNSVFSPLMAKFYLKKEGARSTYLLDNPCKHIFPFIAIVGSVIGNLFFVHSVQIVIDDKNGDISSAVPVAMV